MKSFLIILTFLISLTNALDNGLGLTPPLGFNTWNHFYCNINEDIIKKLADAMINKGLDKLGYVYLNIDDCWMAKYRNEKGELVSDPARFPNGIKNLADYVHAKGLKLGIYSSAGFKTCAGFPASLDREKIDADIWAKWGIDYLKYDNCNHDGRPSIMRYEAMRDALNKTGRPIFRECMGMGKKSW